MSIKTVKFWGYILVDPNRNNLLLDDPFIRFSKEKAEKDAAIMSLKPVSVMIEVESDKISIPQFCECCNSRIKAKVYDVH